MSRGVGSKFRALCCMIKLLGIVTDDENRTNKNILVSLDPNLINHPSFNCYDHDNHSNNNNDDDNKNDEKKDENDKNDNKNCDDVTKCEFANMMRKIGISSNSYSQIKAKEESKNSKNPKEIEKKGKNDDINNEKTNITDRGEIKANRIGELVNRTLDEKDEKSFLPPQLSSSSVEDQIKWRVDLISRIQSTFPDLYRCVSTNVL